MQQSLVRTAIWAVALVCAALILANGGAIAQREMSPPEEPAPAPAPAPEESNATPVMVENFPATQTVDVRNFPLTVTVEGTVDVGNLPLDSDGNVRVAGTLTVEAPIIRVVGVTSNPISLPAFSGLAILNPECSAEFPNSRVCELGEVFRTIPPAADMPLAWVMRESPSILCTSGDKPLDRLFSCNEASPLPVACCGF